MSSKAHSDPTFRSYTAEQAKQYASHRLAYSQALYDIVLNHHTSTGGKLDLLLDCGCGPGLATRDLALSFDQAIGVDPGAAMIAAAQEIGGKTKSGDEIRYVVAAAEDISGIEGLQPESVDLLTAAMAAHWFDMSRFWTEAAKVVRPGGTVALWICSSLFCHPFTPNGREVMKVLFDFERIVLAPYALPGNHLAMDMYDHLPLPWNVSPPVRAFPRSEYVKHDYDRDGELTNGVSFFNGTTILTLADIEKGFGTASMVTRWRAANPDLVGTDKDVLAVFARKLGDALREQDWVENGSGTAILLFKKGH
ncbi:S-adenosyl-L-methionine-dependent methyltransferase [Cadophora sp. MPI-SDFR-AT-0126]|nr:S-adenosyl-L-methionine-dependent methyltransferase [Leotiomycetes sp. MPI-SDFR-AT-0126]